MKEINIVIHNPNLVVSKSILQNTTNHLYMKAIEQILLQSGLPWKDQQSLIDKVLLNKKLEG